MIYIVAPLLVIGLLALLTVMIDTPSKREREYQRKVERQIARDEELHGAYWEFIELFGRPPSARELWDFCPPHD